MIYEQRIKEYVLFYKVKEKSKKKGGLTGNVRAKKRRDEAWSMKHKT